MPDTEYRGKDSFIKEYGILGDEYFKNVGIDPILSLRYRCVCKCIAQE